MDITDGKQTTRPVQMARTANRRKKTGRQMDALDGKRTPRTLRMADRRQTAALQTDERKTNNKQRDGRRTPGRQTDDRKTARTTKGRQKDGRRTTNGRQKIFVRHQSNRLTWCFRVARSRDTLHNRGFQPTEHHHEYIPTCVQLKAHQG